MPDAAGHLVAVDLDDRVLDLDLRHCGRPFARAYVRGKPRRDASGTALWRGRPDPARTKLRTKLRDGRRMNARSRIGSLALRFMVQPAMLAPCRDASIVLASA